MLCNVQLQLRFTVGQSVWWVERPLWADKLQCDCQNLTTQGMVAHLWLSSRGAPQNVTDAKSISSLTEDKCAAKHCIVQGEISVEP